MGWGGTRARAAGRHGAVGGRGGEGRECRPRGESPRSVAGLPQTDAAACWAGLVHDRLPTFVCRLGAADSFSWPTGLQTGGWRGRCLGRRGTRVFFFFEWRARLFSDWAGLIGHPTAGAKWLATVRAPSAPSAVPFWAPSGLEEERRGPRRRATDAVCCGGLGAFPFWAGGTGARSRWAGMSHGRNVAAGGQTAGTQPPPTGDPSAARRSGRAKVVAVACASWCPLARGCRAVQKDTVSGQLQPITEGCVWGARLANREVRRGQRISEHSAQQVKFRVPTSAVDTVLESGLRGSALRCILCPTVA